VTAKIATTTSKLTGKWALITGASRGVGRQIALALAEHGCRLILHGRQASHNEGLARELGQRGLEVKVVAAELADGKAVDQLIDGILGELGASTSCTTTPPS
jgi:short-subunit dehydrogenase